jgi:hypothetical protein
MTLKGDCRPTGSASPSNASILGEIRNALGDYRARIQLERVGRWAINPQGNNYSDVEFFALLSFTYWYHQKI